MDSALYYTFSTIAQALAAAIALLGAFTLYQLQLLVASMLEAAAILRTHTSANRSGIDAAYIVADYTKVFELVRTFQAALLASVLVILGSVIVLSFTPLIVRHDAAALFLALGCLSLGGCLGLYARLLLGHVA